MARIVVGVSRKLSSGPLAEAPCQAGDGWGDGNVLVKKRLGNAASNNYLIPFHM